MKCYRCNREASTIRKSRALCKKCFDGEEKIEYIANTIAMTMALCLGREIIMKMLKAMKREPRWKKRKKKR